MVYDDYIGTFSVDEGAILDAVFENFNHPTPSGFERIMIEKALLWWMSSNVKQKLVAMKRRHFSKLTKEGGGPAAIIFKNFGDKFAFLPALNVSKLPACQLPDSELMDIAMPRSSLAWCRQVIKSSSWHLIWSETSQQGLDILLWGDCQSLPPV